MPVRDEGVACFKKWSTLIKADKISEVLTETEENKLSEEKALECLVYISQLGYKDAQNGVPFNSHPDDIVRLTEILSSLVISRPNLCNLRFISSLYHIAFFFYKKNHWMCLKQIYVIILETRKANISIFHGEGAKVYDSFVLLLKKVIPELAPNEDLHFDQSRTKEFFSIFLNLLVVDDEVQNGSTFLETVLHASQVVAKKNKKKLAVILISKCFQFFFEVKKIKDGDSSLTFIFKLFSSLFHYQLGVTGFASALGTMLSQVDSVKWKFAEANLDHGEWGIFFMCQTKMFMTSQPEAVVRKMIQNTNMMLDKFKSLGGKNNFVKEACLSIIYLVSSLKEYKNFRSSVLLGTCLEPFLEMMLNLYNTLRDFNVDKSYYIRCINDCFFLISEGKPETTKKLLLKDCFKSIMRTEKLFLEAYQMLMSENIEVADNYTKIVLARSANLIQSYHLASLREEVIAVSKPICKFICSLPPHIFDDSQTKVGVEASFSYLIQALGPKQLYEVLEVAVAWLIVCPQSSAKIFRLWGDVKHNAVCGGGSEFLDTTILTIVSEGKSSLEEKWLPCNLNTAQLGHFLVKELNTYFFNSTLRGSPVLEAVKALESLDTDDLTQARGVVVALNVTSARSDYADLCHYYYERSKKLLTALRKQKNQIDFVDYNCCVGELLFCQFRFKLKSFRSRCEGEVLRLSTLHESDGPLVPNLPEDRPDPNDTCDMATGNINLSLDKQKEVLAAMDTAVTHWKVACTRLTQIKELNNIEYDLRITINNLQEAAFIMKLYCDEIKERELWQLLYKLAQLTGDEDSIVIATGEMLATECIDPAAIWEAEDVLSSSHLSDNTKCAFSINQALFHLRKNEVSEGLKLLKTIVDERKSSILNIYLRIILGLYQKLSDWELHRKQFSFSPSCHFSFHKALSNLLYRTQYEKWNNLMEASQIQLYMLEVSYQLGEVNWHVEQPREARCYLKAQLSVAQKLGLPLRTAQLVLLLAWVDLYTGMMADCAGKLEGLETLLNIQGSPASYFDGLENPVKLSKEEVQNPEFLSHPAGCECFACRCTEYQRLVLETLTLRATFCANLNQLPRALQSFKVAFKVRDFLSMSNDVKVQKSFSWMWKHYADSMALLDKHQDGLKANKEAFNSLPSVQSHPILMQHILHQKSYLQSLTTCYNKPGNHRISCEIEETTCSVKTPETRQNPVKTPLSVVSGNVTPQFGRPVRKLYLPSSGEENTPPISKRRIKPPTKLKMETPQTNEKLQNTLKTPFTIVDDDGNAVGMSSSKVSSRVRKKTCTKTNIDDQIHKKLFSSREISAGKESKAPVTFKSPERKSNRKPRLNTTEKTALLKYNSGLKKPESSMKNKDEQETDLEIFSFEKLKEEVSKMERGIPKSTYGKSSSKLGPKKVNSARSHPATVSADADSDCSVVSGTPSPPGAKKTIVRNVRLTRATRSNKTS